MPACSLPVFTMMGLHENMTLILSQKESQDRFLCQVVVNYPTGYEVQIHFHSILKLKTV
jgi:hypothetical protein